MPGFKALFPGSILNLNKHRFLLDGPMSGCIMRASASGDWCPATGKIAESIDWAGKLVTYFYVFAGRASVRSLTV